MQRRIPLSLLVTLATTALVSFAVSLYLEVSQLNFLQAHPIMVNLISGIVGFSTGFLVLSIGVNWFFERQWVIDHPHGVGEGLTHLVNLLETSKVILKSETEPRTAFNDAIKSIEGVIECFELERDDPAVDDILSGRQALDLNMEVPNGNDPKAMSDRMRNDLLQLRKLPRVRRAVRQHRFGDLLGDS